MWSKGICWIDDCRIPFVDEKINFDRPRVREKKEWVYELGITWENPEVKEYNTQGRFPANILVSDDMLNDGTNNKSSVYKGNLLDIRGNKYGIDAKQKLDYGYDRGYNDKGSNSRYYDMDKWFEKIINYE